MIAFSRQIWRKADAGTTSGVVVPLLTMGLWDRARPVGITPFVMILLTILLQLSLTNGYLPYGSSDILLPSLVAIAWILELLPRYGGVVAVEQYTLWGQCFYAVVAGVFLRAADIKRKNTSSFRTLLTLHFSLTLAMLLFLYQPLHSIAFPGLVFGLVVIMSPSKGHIFWHLASSFSLFIWWFMLRTRPGNPSFPFSEDRSLLSIAFYLAVKNAIRRLFMTAILPSFFPSSEDLKERLRVLLEHIFFCALGLYVLVVEADKNSSVSLLRFPMECWRTPPLPSDLFVVYFLTQMGSKLEDVIFMAYRITSSPSSSQGYSKDMKMVAHHAVTALLMVASFLSGYGNIGAVILFLHDISDLPLACLRVLNVIYPSNLFLISVFYTLTLLSWIVWRLIYLPLYVLHAVLYICLEGECSWAETPQRLPFLLLLGGLFVLHIVWFIEILQKGYRELTRARKGVEKKNETEYVQPLLQTID